MELVNVKLSKQSTGHVQAMYYEPKTGKRIRKRFHKLKDAKHFKVYKERSYAVKGIFHGQKTTLRESMDEYLKQHPNSGIRSRKKHFTSFTKYFNDFYITEITTSDIQVWLEKIQNFNGLSNITMNHIKSMINPYFKYLLDSQNIQSNPISKVYFRKKDTIRRKRVILSIEEVNLVLLNTKTFSKKSLYPYLAICAHTGARRGEVVNLLRSDIDFTTGLIHFRETKNSKDRFVRISPMLKLILKEHLNSHDKNYVLLNNDEEALTRSTLSRSLDKFNAFFPIENKHWGSHSLRHSFAYNFLKKSGKMYQLQAILGHCSINVTVDLYGQLQAQDIECPSPYEPNKV